MNYWIDKPCQEKWENMIPQKEGRHCKSCQKVVNDFTNMSNEEIIDFLTKNTNTCGRFYTHQIKKPITKNTFSYKWLLASFLSISTPLITSAEKTTSIEQSQIIHETSKKHTTPKIIEIKGMVTDSLNNPMEGVKVEVYGTNAKTTTNAKGEYVLMVEKSYKKHTLSFYIEIILEEHLPFVGDYYLKEEEIRLRKDLEYNVVFTTEYLREIVFGGLCVEPKGIHQKIWYRTKSLFYRVRNFLT